ncbi:unnamed protein product [Rhodiola kirilowii]
MDFRAIETRRPLRSILDLQISCGVRFGRFKACWKANSKGYNSLVDAETQIGR